MEVRKSGRSRRRIDYAALHSSHVLQELNRHPHIEQFENFPIDCEISDVVCIVDGEKEFNDNDLEELVLKTKLFKPILIKGANPNVKETYNKNIHLDFNIPYYSIDEITDKIDPNRKVPVMDVMTQNNSPFKWDMQRWCNYFKELEKDKIRNVISLEISDSILGNEIEIPKIVSDLDLIYKLFQEDERDERDDPDHDNVKMFKNLLLENDISPPKVQKYILMSVANSYTDFHIDFAGTSVYYSPISGHKKFILIPPLQKNLDVYKKWCLSDNQNEVWFPSLLKSLTLKDKQKLRLSNPNIPEAYLNNGFIIDILPGDLLLLPSSWIHAVLTEKDSIIIGGNFINLLSLQNHLKTYQIEIETKVSDQFKFPNFVKFLWLIAYFIHNNKDNEKFKLNSQHEKNCVDSLIKFLNDQWNYINSPKSKSSSFTKAEKLGISKIRHSIPTDIIGDVPQFLQSLESWQQELSPQPQKHV